MCLEMRRKRKWYFFFHFQSADWRLQMCDRCIIAMWYAKWDMSQQKASFWLFSNAWAVRIPNIFPAYIENQPNKGRKIMRWSQKPLWWTVEKFTVNKTHPKDHIVSIDFMTIIFFLVTSTFGYLCTHSTALCGVRCAICVIFPPSWTYAFLFTPFYSIFLFRFESSISWFAYTVNAQFSEK